MSELSPNWDLKKTQNLAMLAALVGLVGCLVSLFTNSEGFWPSYHYAWYFWFQIPMGTIAFTLLHKIAYGRWGDYARPAFTSARALLLPVFILFLPLLFIGFKHLLPWMNPDLVAKSALLQWKRPYLNVPFFMARAAVFWGIWFVITGVVIPTATGANPPRDRYASSFSLLVFALTATFAIVDWAMSLEPSNYSTLYGLLTIVGQALSAMAFTILLMTLFVPHDPKKTQQLHDLGNLMFAFAMLWSYLTFMQFLIIWSANLPEEVGYYVLRISHGWTPVSVFLMIMGFGFPFLTLLARPIKRNPRYLAPVAAIILAVRMVDVLWVVMPSSRPEGFPIHWQDLAALLFIGGVCVMLAVKSMEKLKVSHEH